MFELLLKSFHLKLRHITVYLYETYFFSCTFKIFLLLVFCAQLYAYRGTHPYVLKHTHIYEHFFVHSQLAFPLQWSLYNCLLDYAAFTIFIFTLEYIKIQKLSVCHSSTYNCNICLLRKLQNILLEWNYPLIQFDTHIKKWFHLLSCKIDSFNIVLHSIYLLTRQG